MTNNKKMTYVDALTSAIEFLTRHEFDSEVVEKLEACRASYEKRKPTAKQVENVNYRSALSVLYYS